jgi:hypothetical protein
LDYTNSFYNSCVISECSGFAEAAKINSCVIGAENKGAGFDHFVAPPLNDYRLHSGADYAISAGLAEYLELIPEEFRYTDFYGKNFKPDGETLATGCSQDIVTPLGGKVVFESTSFNDASSINGGAGYIKQGSTNNFYFGSLNFNLVQMKRLGYIRSAKWPEVIKFKVETVSWKDLYGFKASGADSVWRFPVLDGTYFITAPKSTTSTLTLTPIKADKLFFVDQDSTVENPDGSSSAPFTDLQKAIDSVPSGNYAVIRSRGGVFSSGKTWANELYNRVKVDSGKFVRIIGEKGPDKNFILGEGDASGIQGMGSNAVRCISLGENCAIQGFTLAAGRTNPDIGTGKRGAGAYLGIGAQVLDCVISNCVGSLGAAVSAVEKDKKSNSYIFRSIVAKNKSLDADGSVKGSGIIRNTVAISTVFDSNEGCLTGSYEEQAFYFCTIAHGGSSQIQINAIGSTSFLYNTVVLIPNDDKINSATVYGGVLNFTKGAVSNDSSGYTRNDAWLADYKNGDFRPATISPVKTAVNLDYGELLHTAITCDAYRHEFVFSDGLPLCGAVHSQAPTVVVTSSNDLEELSGARTNVFSSAGEMEFVAQKAAIRPFLGIEVVADGQTVTNLSQSYLYTVAPKDDLPETIKISVNALYDTNWYVDAKKGNDSYFGTESSPKLTLAAALTNAISGDVVHVASGEYRTGKMYQKKQLGNNDGDYSLPSRAVVPDGVELCGAGAESTFIIGELDLGASESENGCGPKAVRCVALGTGSKLKGFTLTGGRTYVEGNADSFHGGGVLASAKLPLAQIEDCIISNCVARRGGGGFFGLYNRCKFFGNATINAGNGAALRGNGDFTAYLYNSIVDDCKGWATAYMITEIANCTFGSKICDANGGYAGASVIQDCFDVKNTLVHGNPSVGVGSETRKSVLTRCVLSEETVKYFNNEKINMVNCVVEPKETLATHIDELYRPIIGSSSAVDAADLSLYDNESLGGVDVYGNPRKVNGCLLDIGAVEADWKSVYSRTLGKSVNVIDASPEVLLDKNVSGLQIPAGATLSLICGREGAMGSRTEIKASVPVNGTLEVAYQNESDILQNGIEQILAFKPKSDFTDIVFASDGGTSILHGIYRNSHLTLIIK